MNYIIQQGVQIGNPENKTIDVLTSDQINNYLKNGFWLKERMYKLTSGHSQYTVVCWEIWKENDTEHSLILPEFLIPHRTYTVYVYAYAIALYSANPEKSQRAVAEETRKKFGLQTFAHTTVGRAMGELARILTGLAPADGRTVTGVQAAEQQPPADAATEDVETVADRQAGGQDEAGRADKTNASIYPAERFSTLYTKAQRELVRSFFSSRADSLGQHSFKEASGYIVAYWHVNFCQLYRYISAPAIGCKLSM